MTDDGLTQDERDYNRALGKLKAESADWHAQRKRDKVCIEACAGFGDPMELRKQRDAAVAIIEGLLEEDVHEPTCSVPVSAFILATRLAGIISKGSTPTSNCGSHEAGRIAL